MYVYLHICMCFCWNQSLMTLYWKGLISIHVHITIVQLIYSYGLLLLRDTKEIKHLLRLEFSLILSLQMTKLHPIWLNWMRDECGRRQVSRVKKREIKCWGCKTWLEVSWRLNLSYISNCRDAISYYNLWMD